MDQSASAQALSSFQDAYKAFLSSFDPRHLHPHERDAAIGILARVQKSVTLMGAVAGALIANEPIGPYGAVSHMKAVMVKNRCKTAWGVSAQQAERTLETGLRLVDQPEAARAALDGDLSVDQAALVTETVGRANLDAMTFLLATARRGSLTLLSAECRRVRQLHAEQEPLDSATGPEEYFLSDASGNLKSWLDSHGRWRLSVCGTREDGERVMAAIEDNISEVLSADDDAQLLAPGRGKGFYQGLVALCDRAAEVRGTERVAKGPLEVGRSVRRSKTKSRWRWAGAPAPPPERPPFPLDGLDWLFHPVETLAVEGPGEAPPKPAFYPGAAPKAPG